MGHAPEGVHGESHGHGHGHGHGGKNIPHDMPVWTDYKIDGLKDLEKLRDKLAAKGLKDPWIRNDVWRYMEFPGVGRSVYISFRRGFKWAFGAMVVTILAHKYLGIGGPINYGGSHHGEGSDSHENHSSGHH